MLSILSFLFLRPLLSRRYLILSSFSVQGSFSYTKAPVCWSRICSSFSGTALVSVLEKGAYINARSSYTFPNQVHDLMATALIENFQKSPQNLWWIEMCWI